MRTLALCCIAKNEEKHVERFLKSFLPVVDKIYFTDTGSTDKTVEIAKQIGGDKIEIRHFDWVNDFSAARNFSCSNIKEEYILWGDLDDSMHNPESFLEWRKDIDQADIWLATYHYASDKDGNPVCSFVRERVFKSEYGTCWQYPIHEGIGVITPNAKFTNQWAIKHHRTVEDLSADKGRNLKVFEYHKDSEIMKDPRMQYYWGKELYEAGQPKEAIEKLLKAVQAEKLEHHDRIIAIQYSCYSLMQLEKYQECISMAQQGLTLAPNRAEFYVLIGDCYIKLAKVIDAIPSYAAAQNCFNSGDNNRGFSDVIFQHKDAYGVYPTLQLSRCYLQLGWFEKALEMARVAMEKYATDESKLLHKEIERVVGQVHGYKTATNKVDDIVFSCLAGMYEWDEKIAQEKGVGGSEIAAIQMAKWLRKKTGRRVILFTTPREKNYTTEDGVEYKTTDEMYEYFTNNVPALHVAWRHVLKLTNAKTVIWNHDLMTPGLENYDIYDKTMFLSDWQKSFNKSMVHIPEDKVYMTRNGIEPKRFDGIDFTKKNPLKWVYVSSPDRSLKETMLVMDLVRTKYPVELHVFYGFHNMEKGNDPRVKELKEMIEARPWVHMHGAVKQDLLPLHYKDAAGWLYVPPEFCETFSISILETGLCGVYGIIRDLAALKQTAKPWTDIGAMEVHTHPIKTLDDFMYFADKVVSAIEEKKWEKTIGALSPKQFSWEGVAEEWIRDLL